MSTATARSCRRFGDLVQKAGPYLLIEILLPGGTLIALLLYAYQRKRELGAALARTVEAVYGRLSEAALPDVASAWRGRHRQRDGLEALALLSPV